MEMKGRIIVLTGFFLAIQLVTFSQNEYSKYWITFTDKDNTPYSLESPDEFLSERSIARRLKQDIVLTEEDLPVDPQYVNALKNLGIEVINVSKWFNGAIISSDDIALIDSLETYSFIATEAILIKPALSGKILKDGESEKFNIYESPNYGYSASQIEMLHGEFLHRGNYEGQDMLIAILDAGFTNANEISSLQHIWSEERVIAIKDFVKDSIDFFESARHGTTVFSIMGGIIEDSIYGTATKANYALIRTEDISSEYIIEEYNWICGAEFADSLGADIINSSLGYSLFDDSLQNHHYSDMDGETTPVSIGANVAASKGMVVVCSAGNAGGTNWFRITAPSDAVNVVAIGAVNSEENIAVFSSRGPSYDQRVKPDICAQGVGTLCQSASGNISYCGGTSCSAPVISGMAACLWQANPDASYIQILESVKKSASQFNNPDSLCGYGIPDFFFADRYLKDIKAPPANNMVNYNLFPNPVGEYLYLEILRPLDASDETALISYYNLLGTVVKEEEVEIIGAHCVLNFEDLGKLMTGMYYIKIEFPGGVHTLPFMKIK